MFDEDDMKEEPLGVRKASVEGVGNWNMTCRLTQHITREN